MHIVMRVIPILNRDIISLEKVEYSRWYIFTFFKSIFSRFTDKNWEKCSDKVNNIFPQLIFSLILLLNILSMTVAVFSVTLVG